MPRVFDNIELDLLPALKNTIGVAERGDFCVGYFNLRGWKRIAPHIDQWPGGDGRCCRVLVGMQRLPQQCLRNALVSGKEPDLIDNKTAASIKRSLAEEFKAQLTVGTPTNEDEAALQKLANQIRKQKVVVKLFLRHPLHAKLYLLFRQDHDNPITGYLGSSNLTMAGLSKQGELNVDVLDNDACNKLAKWFKDRWEDQFCIDISEELVSIIEQSWAGPDLIPPYHIYAKMAYHLSEEAREGLTDFRLPDEFKGTLFTFQEAAVKIAAHHLNKRGGVLIGDVVGLGKTLMATALARIFEDDHGLETLVICPKNLTEMWEDYCHQYRLRSKVMSITRVTGELPDTRRYRLVVIDESHNLRNREGKRYRAIHEYIQENDSKCILLTATPYNKSYLDLSSQLRLFVPEENDIGIRPEQLFKELGETEFSRKHQCSPRSLAAFEKSENFDDWRELMRLFLVRRTRTFIKDNYARTEPETGRKYLTFPDGSYSYFPERRPKTADFEVSNQYAQLYDDTVVNRINRLSLPRYGLGNYLVENRPEVVLDGEEEVMDDLSKAGQRLKGFCRTNLFKRLESSGTAFIQSVERHILRNYVFIHALENGLPIPIGTQDVQMLDPAEYDEDADAPSVTGSIFEDDGGDDSDTKSVNQGSVSADSRTEDDFLGRAAEIYRAYAEDYKKRFRWLRSIHFCPELVEDLRRDAHSLMKVLQDCGNWDPDRDSKLDRLHQLIAEKHPDEKIIIFSQFADTVRYLERLLKKRGVERLEGVTGDTANPTRIAWRFSPVSNNKRDEIASGDELRVVLSTDVLSEGQNLQDCAIVVNYDLPWAIIRLVQRAGRVDRIGQNAEEILCYSFMPADGVEKILHLRGRVRKRLKENAEVVGTDEAFFEDDHDDQKVVDLYNEMAGILDDDPDSEVDLASYALQIWQNAVEREPDIGKIVPNLSDVVYSTRQVVDDGLEEGALVFMRTADGADALAWMDQRGKSYTESQFQILKAARCEPDTPPVARQEKHHALVQRAVEHVRREERNIGGQLGRPAGARYRTYVRLKEFMKDIKDQMPLFQSDKLQQALQDMYRYPLRQAAVDTLNRQLRSGINDPDLAELVVSLRDEDRLCIAEDQEPEREEPQIICSMGLTRNVGEK